jgi:hypothetical protein
MNMLGLLLSVRIAHIACYWKFFLVHCIQVICQSRLCKADHAYLTYFMLQRQLNHLNGRKFDHRQMWELGRSRDIDLERTTRKTRRTTVLSLLHAGRCLATAVVSLFVSQPFPHNGPICNNMFKGSIFLWAKCGFQMRSCRGKCLLRPTSQSSVLSAKVTDPYLQPPSHRNISSVMNILKTERHCYLIYVSSIDLFVNVYVSPAS